MDEFKGTRGIWFYRPELGEVVCVGRGVIADMICNGDENENGRVVAAAPALLASLQQLVEVYDSEDGKQWTTTSKRAALSAARAEIAKAIGK